MTPVNREFARRVALIPPHGLGLSVDVYSPDLFELAETLAGRGAVPGYWEVFRAAQPALAEVRRRLPDALLEYHGEGLWLTQPDWTTAYPFNGELDEAAAHLRTLGSHWMTHECAAKQMAGYTFGTYLPPLYTAAGAEVAAGNLALTQRRLDRDGEAEAGFGPLVLLEMPPLTYFGLGDLPIPEFFRLVAERTPCGLVLDIGHLWTLYRYAGWWRREPLPAFVADFLDAFPLERVVQIHVAGLAEHVADAAGPSQGPPRWIDAHGSPIPEVLEDLLEQVLAHPRLVNLRGLALEVDTKPISRIVVEFERFRKRFGRALERWRSVPENVLLSDGRDGREVELNPVDSTTAARLLNQYGDYARFVTGHPSGELPSLEADPDMLELYRRTYLPYEILHWGGELRDMFPATCLALEEAGVPLGSFVAFWFREPRPCGGPYDFFLRKLDRFTAFVQEVLPQAAPLVQQEADGLRRGYRAACERVSA